MAPFLAVEELWPLEHLPYNEVRMSGAPLGPAQIRSVGLGAFSGGLSLPDRESRWWLSSPPSSFSSQILSPKHY